MNLSWKAACGGWESITHSKQRFCSDLIRQQRYSLDLFTVIKPHMIDNIPGAHYNFYCDNDNHYRNVFLLIRQTGQEGIHTLRLGTHVYFTIRNLTNAMYKLELSA